MYEVYERLSGREGDRVLRLRSPFGGGKSHTLASLFYSVKNRGEVEKVVSEIKGFPQSNNARVSVFDGEKFDATVGKTTDGQRIRTMCGYITWQLSEYELVREQDRNKTAPGGEIIKKILGDIPTLILADEIAGYLENTMTVKVGESTLYRLRIKSSNIGIALSWHTRSIQRLLIS